MPVKENLWSAVHWGICHTSTSYTKKLRIPKAKSTTNQFILSKKKLQKYLWICENQKKHSELLRGGLWFVSELLWKILTIAERRFSGKISQRRIFRIWVEELYESATQCYDRIVCWNSSEIRSETRWRYSSCKDLYSSMIIFQSEIYC